MLNSNLIIDSIYSHASQFPEKTALFDGDKTISYQQLVKLIDEKVAFFKKHHIRSIALKNIDNLDFIVYDLACLKENILCLHIPSFFTEQQITNAIEKSHVNFILDHNKLTKLNNSKETLKNTQKITFTSGSTGEPKGVCLSIENINNVIKSLTQYLSNEELAIHSSMLPYSILLENIAGLYLTLHLGGKVNFSNLRRLSGQDIFEKLFNSKANSTILVPELLKELLNYMEKHNKKLPDIKFIAVGGSKVSLDLLVKAQGLMLPVYQGYGLSENSSVLALNNSHNNRIGSIGKILPHANCYIAEDGELIIKNPQFLGYSDKAHNDEYKTGDIANLDEDGYLYITGRKKNLIITSMGRNISPEWPESILLNHPQIAQAIVYGDAKKHLKALIVKKHNETNLNLQEIKEITNYKLPEYAQIKDITIVENFAKNNLLTGNMRPKREQILKFYNLD